MLSLSLAAILGGANLCPHSICFHGEIKKKNLDMQCIYFHFGSIVYIQAEVVKAKISFR